MSASHYETSNVYLAGFLLCQKAAFRGFDRVNKRRFLYRFVADERLHELLRLWWRNTEMMITPGRLFACLQRLKSLTRGSPVATPNSTLPQASNDER